MKVIQINATYSNDSVGGIVKTIHNELTKTGHESYVFVSENSIDSNDKNVISFGSSLSKKAHALMTRITGKQGFYSRSSTKEMVKMINRINPDIIHLHNLHANYINLPLLLTNIKNKNIVVTMHDCWDWTGKCFHYTHSQCEKWKTQCDKCPQKNEYVKNYLIDHSKFVFENKKELFTNCENLNIVCVSNWVKNQIDSSFFKNTKQAIIYNDVDTDIFYSKNKSTCRKIFGLPENCKIILGTANKWNESKNAKVVESILDFCKKNGFVVVIIGNLSKTNECVINIPYQKDKDSLASLFSCVDAFINLSLEDTMSIITAEAISCGTKCLAYKTTAIEELLNKNNDYVANYLDEVDVINGIKTLLNNSNCDINLFVKNNCSKGTMSRKYIDFYNKILNS